MAEIAKIDGQYYYRGKKFDSAESLYKQFHKDYNAEQGKSAYLFLQRLGQRKERVHGSRIIYTKGFRFRDYPGARIKCYMLSLLCGSYCKMIGVWDIPYEIDDEWIRWILRDGGKELKVVGIKHKTGRTSKRLNKRYK